MAPSEEACDDCRRSPWLLPKERTSHSSGAGGSLRRGRARLWMVRLLPADGEWSDYGWRAVPLRARQALARWPKPRSRSAQSRLHGTALPKRSAPSNAVASSPSYEAMGFVHSLSFIEPHHRVSLSTLPIHDRSPTHPRCGDHDRAKHTDDRAQGRTTECGFDEAEPAGSERH